MHHIFILLIIPMRCHLCSPRTCHLHNQHRASRHISRIIQLISVPLQDIQRPQRTAISPTDKVTTDILPMPILTPGNHQSPGAIDTSLVCLLLRLLVLSLSCLVASAVRLSYSSLRSFRPPRPCRPASVLVAL